MRFARSFLVGLVALGTAACTSTDTSPTRAAIPPLAFVRYINAIPDTLNTTVRWVDDIQFTPLSFINTPYRTEATGGFQGLRAGERHLRVFPFLQVGNDFPVNGNTWVMVDTTFNFEAGAYYTLLHTGFARVGSTPQQRLLIIRDDPPASPAAGILLRVYNLAYTTAAWDVRFGPSAVILDTIAAGPPVVTAQKDTTVGRPYSAAQAGTLVNSGAPGTVETVTRAYSAFATGTYAARMFDQGTLTGRGVRVPVPTGLPETVDFEAVGGSNVNGSVMTMWVFDRKTATSPNSTGQVNTRASVMFTVDRKPARTIAP